MSQALAVLREAKEFADLLADSTFVPQAYRGKPGDIMACVAFGGRLGLEPFTSLQGIAVINGRPAIWGDAALAVCRQHREWQDISEEQHFQGPADDWSCSCTVVRRGQTPTVRTFSVRDAKRAGLWDKAGPWKQYPQRMLQLRARGFALRDAFADALTGVYLREEVEDLPAETPPRALDSIPEGRRMSLRMPEPEPEPEPAPAEEPTAAEPPPAADPAPSRPATKSWRDVHAGDWPTPACPECVATTHVAECLRATEMGSWECRAEVHGSKALRFHRAPEDVRGRAEAACARAEWTEEDLDAAGYPADSRAWAEATAAAVRDDAVLAADAADADAPGSQP